MKTVRISSDDGPELAVDVYAPEGPARAAILFLHGFGSRRDGEMSMHLGRSLSGRGLLYVAPDLQGHGESEGEFGEITIERSMRDAGSVARATGVLDAPRRILVGSSFGALVAGWLAVEQPDTWERVVLLSPAFGFVERYAESLPPETLAAWRGGEPVRVVREWFEVDLDRGLLLEAERRPADDLARRLAQPTLVIHGRLDESVPVEASRRFAERSPNPDLERIVIEDGDHRLTAHKQRLADEIARFVSC